MIFRLRHSTLEECRNYSACWKYAQLFFILAVFFMAFGQQPLKAESVNDPGLSERKAGTIFNLCKFIYWPESVDNASKDEFIICTAQENGIFQELQNFQGQHVAGRPIQIQKITADESALRQCRVLFLPFDAEPDSYGTLLASVSRYPVLTISDAAGFADGNGMVELVLVTDRVRFIINLNRVREANLSVATPLLNLAATVRHDR